MSTADGFRALREDNKQKPILNENIFYNYEWDNTPIKKAELTKPIPLDEYIRDNTGYKAIKQIDAEGIKLLGIGLIVLIVVNIFKK